MERIAYIGGTFDLMHPGHVELFRKAKRHFDRVIVSLNTDEFASRYKRKPAMTLSERMTVVGACRYVDNVVINTGCEDTGRTIDSLPFRISAIVHGDDWTGEAYKRQLGITDEWLRERDIDLVYFSYTGGISTSDLLKRLQCE